MHPVKFLSCGRGGGLWSLAVLLFLKAHMRKLACTLEIHLDHALKKRCDTSMQILKVSILKTLYVTGVGHSVTSKK